MAGSLGDMIVKVGANIDGFERAMGSVSSRLNAIDRQADRAFSGFDRLGGRLQDVGTTLTVGLTAPLAAAAAAALKTSGDFELAFNKVKAFGAIGEQELEKLRQLALKLGADTQFSAQQAADAMVVFSSAGFSANQTYAAMPGTLALAAAGQLEVGEAATVTKDILGQFRLEAAESGRVADVLAQAAADSSASLMEMATTLTYAGPVAKGAGQSLEETTAAIVALDAAGIRGEKAGTGMRGVLASLISPSTDAARAMSGLGISVENSNGKMRPLSDIMEQFRQKLGTVHSEVERNNLIFQIFGREAGNAAQVLISTGGPALDQLERKLLTSQGAADRMAKTINSGLNFGLDQFKGSVETAGIALGTALIPSATRALAVLTDFVNNAILPAVQWFGQLPTGVQDTAIALAAVLAVTGPLAVGMGLMLSSLGSVAAAFTSSIGVLTTFGATAVPAAIAAVRTFALTSIPQAVGAVAAFATTTLPAAILQIGLLAEIMLRQAVVSVTTFATTAIPAAITAVTTFAMTSVPAAIAAVTTFATSSVPAAASSLVTLATTSIPAAITSFQTFAVSGIGAAITGMQTMAAASVPYLIAALSTLGVAALAAGAAFAGWKLGEWAYANIPAVKALGDAIGDLILKIPLAETALLRLTGATAAQDRAQKDLEYSTGQLERSLRAKGVIVERGVLSLEDYNKKLRDAAKQSGLMGGAHKTSKPQVDASTQAVRDAQRQAAEYERALRDAGKATRDTGDEHDTARRKVREFQDGIPAAVIAEYERRITAATKEIARHRVETELARLAGRDWAGQLQTNITAAQALSAQLQEAASNKFPSYVAGLGDIKNAAATLPDALKEAVQQTTDEVEGLLGEVEDESEQTSGVVKSHWDRLGDDIKGIFADTTRDLGRMLFDGDGSFGQRFGQMAKDLGRAVLMSFVQPATDAIGEFLSGVVSDLLSGKGLGGVLDSLKEIGSAMKSIFGGASTAANAAGNAAGAAGGAGNAAGGVAGAGGAAGSAASGALGTASMITGIVTGIVTAVSSVISNFQLARQENTLNAIEESTRYVKIWTGEQSQNLLWCAQKSTEYQGYMVASLDTIGRLASEQLGWMGRIGGVLEDMVARAALPPAPSGMTVNFNNATINNQADADYLLDELERRMNEIGQGL